MEHVTANIRTDQLEQIEEVKESVSSVHSEDEAIRHIIDRAGKADLLEKEVDYLNRRVKRLKEQHKTEIRQASRLHKQYLDDVIEERDELREQVCDEKEPVEYDHDRYMDSLETTEKILKHHIMLSRASFPREIWWLLTGTPVDKFEEYVQLDN